MAKKYAFLFPGQGAQAPGMVKDVAEAFPSARKVIGDVRFDSTVFCEDAKFVLDVCSNSKKVICTSERLYYHLRRCGNSLTNTSLLQLGQYMLITFML